MNYSISQVSKSAGISVRTLHYYDEIGLLKPSFVRENGYRTYGEKELIRLQQILFFRELGFPLYEIVKIVTDLDFDVNSALADQKKILTLKRERLDRLIEEIEKSMNNGGKTMNTQDLYAAFSMKEIEEYKKEAKKRWGNTKAYRQATERTKYWTKKDYAEVAESWKVLTNKLAETMDKGFDSPEFQALVAEQHNRIGVFYDCPVEMFRNLGNMYAADPRFRKNYDSVRPGLAEFLRQAINFYCDREEKT